MDKDAKARSHVSGSLTANHVSSAIREWGNAVIVFATYFPI